MSNVNENLRYLTNAARYPKVTVNEVEVPKAQQTSTEYNKLVECVQNLKDELDNQGVLLDTEGQETSDVTKCNKANACIQMLWMKTRPSTGHRHVLNYLYHWGDAKDFRITLLDLDISAGTTTTVLSQYQFEGDKICELKNANGDVIGKIYCDTASYQLIANQGESYQRMPYLSGKAYNLNQGKLVEAKLDEILAQSVKTEELVHELNAILAPTLFGSDLIEATDVTKLNRANAMVRAIVMNEKPAAGHRYVLGYVYLQTSDNTWYYSIYDLNVSANTTTTICSNKMAVDKVLSDITDTNGNVIGKILLDTTYYTGIIADQGEGYKRLPYMLAPCFDASSQFALNTLVTNNRIEALEHKGTQRSITVWGDSITWGSGSSTNNNYFAKLLDQYIKADGYEHNVVNCGVGGDNCASILVRMGATALYIDQDVTIPKTAGTTVTIDTITNYQQVNKVVKAACKTTESVNLMIQQDLGRGFWATNADCLWMRTINPVVVNGVECEWKYVATDSYKAGSYTLGVCATQSKDITLKAGTPIYPHGCKIKSDVLILCMGTNGGFSTADEYVKWCEYAIEAANTDRYIICTPYGGTCWTNLGVSGMNALENACLARFGAHYFNWRKFMMNEALPMNNMTATGDDLMAIYQGKCPPSLIPDGVHPNDAGHTAIAKRLFQMVKALGYLD